MELASLDGTLDFTTGISFILSPHGLHHKDCSILTLLVVKVHVWKVSGRATPEYHFTFGGLADERTAAQLAVIDNMEASFE